MREALNATRSGAATGVLIGGGAMQSTRTGEMKFHLALLDFDRLPELEPVTIELGFLAHGITPSPHDSAQLVLFEKHGPGCCVVDVRGGEVVHTLHPGAAREFYGHGTHTADGELLLCTQSDVADGRRGYISVRDARTFAPLGEFPSYGLAPHDCWIVDAGATLVVANGGSPVGGSSGPNVAFVDVGSRKLLDSLDIPVAHLNAGHLALAEGGQVVVVSAPREGLDPQRSRGGISFGRRSHGLRTASEPNDVVGQMLGETLSVAIHEPTGIVGATQPTGNLVTFWDLASGVLRKVLRVPNPRGIAISLDGAEFVINWGSPPRAARVDAKSLAPADAPGNRRGYLSLATGSHIMMASAAAFA